MPRFWRRAAAGPGRRLPRLPRIRYWLAVGVAALVVTGWRWQPETSPAEFSTADIPPGAASPRDAARPPQPWEDATPAAESGITATAAAPGGATTAAAEPGVAAAAVAALGGGATGIAAHATAMSAAPPWTEVRVRKGDSLARIFKRLGLPQREVREIVVRGQPAAALKRLRPGQKIAFQIDDAGKLQALRFDFDLTKRLLVTRQAQGFAGEVAEVQLDALVRRAEGVIDDSLFLAGKAAGLSAGLIMQLVELYGWDIDFIMDIRKGDRFKVVYEEQYKDGEKVLDGPILAAEFVNQGRKIRAARRRRENGRAEYYNEAGANMRKTFLKSPLKFSRISSRFNLRRKHPVLNRIRAHRGVDYAAPTGTPVKTTGDGVVHYVGGKGGYGRTVIVQHGGKYSTLYAHLSRYKRGLRRGRAVKQGQVIGYVGKSGLATGPHLHYEFRVNGVHRNPLTAPRPKAEGVPAAEMDAFRAHSSRLFAMLDEPLLMVAAANATPPQAEPAEPAGRNEKSRL